jgi:aminoglycoside 6'-N-acetyltransferase I
MGKQRPADTPAGVTIIRIARANATILSKAADDVFDNPVDQARAAACAALRDYRLFVAIAEGVVIGQARGFIQPQPDDASWLYVDNLGVSNAWKRKGIASALIERIVAWGVSRGAILVWLGSEPDNSEASGFYRALGFEASPMVTWSKPLPSSRGQ